MPSWYALFEGSQNDVAALKRHFAASRFSFDEIEGKSALAAPQLEACAPGDIAAVIDAATDLFDSVNVTLRLSDARYNELELCGVVERRDGKTTHRVLVAGSGIFSISTVAVAVAGSFGPPVRSKEERLVSLMGHDDRIADIAHDFSLRPKTWAALAKTYETVVGIMSSKQDPQKARGDFKNLIEKKWFTCEESSRFYNTAAFYRHGHPKSSNRTPNPMSYEDACAFIGRLFWRLVDEREPT